MSSEDEMEAAKDYLWKLFIWQMACGWKVRFPRMSGIGNYIHPEMLEWLEEVGRNAGNDALRKSVNEQ